jgi:hypothetical protein
VRVADTSGETETLCASQNEFDVEKQGGGGISGTCTRGQVDLRRISSQGLNL